MQILFLKHLPAKLCKTMETYVYTSLHIADRKMGTFIRSVTVHKPVC